MYRLEMTDDLGRVITHPVKVDQGKVTIGRKSENDIVLSDLSVSRNHAVIYEEEIGLYIEDLGSANGVIVNGRQVEGTEIIKGGDEIIIGENRFILKEGDGPTTDRTMIDFK